MGASQSALKSTSPSEKFSGLMRLTNGQIKILNMLSDVFEQLLTDNGNDVFSLSKVLGSPDQCSALIMILSNKFKDEFHTLNFPDPLSPDNKIQVSYVLQSEYKDLEKEPNRQSLCVSLIFFMIRLVTLVAAIVASLKINNNIVNLLDIIKYEPLSIYNRNYKRPNLTEEHKKVLKIRSPVNEQTLDLLKKGGLVQVLTEDGTRPDPRNLYYFNSHQKNENNNNKNILVLNSTFSCLYFGKTEESGLYGITIREIDQAVIKRQEERSDSGLVHAGGKKQRQSQTQKQKQRHIQIQKTRKLKRGGAITLFSVNLTKLFCTNMCEPIPEFYMENDGTTYEVSDYLEKIRGLKLTIPMKSLTERIQEIENTTSDKLSLVVMRDDEPVTDHFGPLSKVDKDTLKYFRNIQNAIKNKKEGTSPCFYRSYLLASRIDGDTLQTLICSDDWTQKKITSQVAYSLLQALYLDRPDATMDSQTADECVQTIDRLATVFDINKTTSYNPTLESLSFLQIPPEVRATVCITGDKGGRSIREPAKLSILMKAHESLHTLFENHIKNSVDLIQKVMSLEATESYLSKPKIKLDPVFVKDPLGSLHALEGFIKEARGMLSTHYFEVETVYQSALNEIAALSRGNAPVNPNEKNILGVAAENLPN